MACVIDYARDNITIYLNGVPQYTGGTVAFTATKTDNTTSQTSSIGIDEDKVGGDFDGQIDELRFYNRILSAKEIAALAAGKNTSAETSNYTVAEDFTLTAGSFYPTSTFTITGNWSNTGTFNHNNSTVVLNGSNQAVNGDTTFYNLTKTVAATDTITFQANKTQTITNALTLKGANLNLLSLRSSLNGTQWNINPQGTRDIEYLDVKDSNNTNVSEITVTGLNITDSTNNTNWGFEGTEPAISLTALSPDPNGDNTPSITGTATEDVGTVSNIEYQMDGTGGAWTACTADDGTFDETVEAFTCTVSPSLTDGSHTIYVRATDSDDNVTPNESAATDSFTIDTSAPVISLNAYTPDPTSDTTPSLTGSITDLYSNTAGIEYQIDGTLDIWLPCTADDGSFNETSENFTCTVSPALSEGNHTIYMIAFDELNNTTVTEDMGEDAFTIDTTAPTVPGTPSATTGPTDNTPTWQWAESTDASAGLSATTAYTLEWSKNSGFLSGVSTTQVGTNNCSAGTCTYTNISILSDGTWYFRVKAEDILANTSNYSSNGSTFIDNTNPALTLTPITPDPTTDTTPTLTGTANDSSSTISNVQYQMNGTGGSWLNCTADDGTFDEASEAFTCNVVAELTGGSHTIYTRATDSSGNISSNILSHRDTFSVDLSAPSITLTPLSPDPIADSTPTISGSATDATATISNIQYQLDGTGGTWRNCTATDGTFDEASEDFTCTTISTTDGNHTIYVRATDSTGNTTPNVSASTDSFIIDTTYPAISFTAITPDPNNDDTPTITGTATDTHGTVATVNYQIDGTGGSWSACSADDGTFDEASENFSCTVSPALDDGSHTIYLQAIDALNNTTDTIHLSSDTFAIDTTSATITLDPINQNGTNDATPNITGNVVDSLLTIANAQFQMDGTGGSWNNCSADDGAFNEADEDFTCSVLSTLNEGAHTIYVRVTDSEGKTTANGAAETLDFNVDLSAPSISLTPISPDPTNDTTPTISGTATDTYVFVSTVLFQIDGTSGPVYSCTATDGSFGGETSEAFSCTAPADLTDGSHTYYVRSVDSLSNTTQTIDYEEDTFVVSTEAPTITLGTVTPDPTGDSTPSITGNATSLYSTVTNIQYQVDVTNGTWNDCTADDSTFNSNDEDFTCTVGSALSQGAHTIYVRAVDAFGSTTPNDDLVSDLFTVDTGGPSVSLSALSPDPSSDNTPAFSGTASDIFSTISAVSYQIDSTIGSWSACTPNDSLYNSSPEAFNCTPPTLSDGNHTIYVRATDSLNNVTAGASYASDTFTIDTTAPTTPGTPSASTSSDDPTPTWNWTASIETGSGLSSSTAYTLEWSQASDFLSGVSTANVGTSNCTAGTCSYTHSTSLDNATWYFRVKATDNLNQSSAFSTAGSINISASADSNAPTGSIAINLDGQTNPAYIATRNVVLGISATDDLSSQDDLELMISEDVTFAGASWQSYSSSKNFTLSENSGTKTVYLKIKDINNNQSETYSDSVIYDIDKPSKAKLENPADEDFSTDEKPTFKFKKSTDTHSGIREYKLIIDGEEFNSNDIETKSNGSYIEMELKKSLKDEEHKWKIKTIDNVGNYEESEEWKIIIDTEKPNLQLLSVDKQATKIFNYTESGKAFTTTNNNPQLTGKSEGNSKIEIKIQPNNAKCETTANENGEWDCTLNLEKNIRYELKIKSIDEAGNEVELPKIYLIKANYTIQAQATIAEETQDENEPTQNDDSVVETETDNEENTSSDETIESRILVQYKLTVKVVDNKGNPIKNAKITVFSEPKTDHTNEGGMVVFENMEEGQHKIVIENENGVGEKEIELTGSNTEVKYEIVLVKSQNLPLWGWLVLSLLIVIILGLVVKLFNCRG